MMIHPRYNKNIWAGFLGNILETYDLIVYGLMAHFIAANFFKSNEPHSLFYAFGILFLGYLARPLGALLFGYYSDYRGRKRAIAYSSLFVGLTTGLIGLLPTYNSIGISAMYLLLVLRCLQGVASGGEYTNSIIFLAEHGYQNQRGFMGSWATNGNCVGFLVASLVGVFTSFLLTHHWLPAWGWRMPFLIAIVGALLIFRLQRRSQETLPFIRRSAIETPQFFSSYAKSVIATLRRKKSACIRIVMIFWLSVSFTYLIFIYGPIHMVEYQKIHLYPALMVNAITLICTIVLTPFFGHWSDRIGRKPFLVLASLCFFIGAYPYFWLASHPGHWTALCVLNILFSIPAAAFYGIAPVLMIELIPIETRGLITGFIYNLVASVIGGAAPLIALSSIRLSGHPAAPALYLMISAVITLAGLFKLKEPTDVLEGQTNERLPTT